MPVEMVILWMCPALAFWAAFRVPGIARALSRTLRDRRRRRENPLGSLQRWPVERLTSDLHRLSGDLDRVLSTDDMPGRVLRLRAFSQAYDDTLLTACRALGVPTDMQAPLSDLERLQTEAALAQQGLRW